jgi:putative PEP-CTERM system histidine kinase
MEADSAVSIDAGMVLVGHALNVLSFAALIFIILLGKRASPFRGPVLLAAGGTILWSVITVATAFLVDRPVIVPLVEWLKISVWLWLTASLLSAVSRERTPKYLRLAKTGIAIPLTLIVGLTALNIAGVHLFNVQMVNLILAIAFMAMSVFGLALVETLSRGLSAESRRAAQFYVLSIGLLFSVDLFLFATLLLLGQVDATIFAIRGFCLAAVPPMLAVAFARHREWVVDVHVSRDVVVNAVTLLGAGVYLLTMALAGFAARELNVTWGPLLHLLFLAGAIVLLIAIVSSERLRPRLRNWVSQNFFSAKYDYRREWLRFSDALTSQGGLRVEERILDGVLQSLQCQSGGLWLRLEDGSGYALAAARPRSVVFENPDVHAVSDRLVSTGGAVVLQQFPALAALPFRKPWVAVPVLHRGDMAGFLVLAEAAFDAAPNAEDLELLKALSVQSAVHLAEERAAAALGRTERFEGIARRLTYVGHDLKNIVSQISMVIQNWERHRDNPLFTQQLPSTLQSAVTRMKGLVEGIREVREPECGDEIVDLSGCLSELMILWRARHADMTHDINVAGARVRARLEHVQSVLDQLVSNAIEAGGPEGRIHVSAGRTDREAWCEIGDSGGGMPENVIAGSSFGAANSSKPHGFGVGLFQVRDYVRRIGGTLSFAKRDGGTSARVVFPILIGDAQAEKAPLQIVPAGLRGEAAARVRLKT